MTALTPGANTGLADTALQVATPPGLDVTALVLTDRHVEGDDDMVFYNQPAAPGVTWQPDAVVIDLSRLRPGATKVALVASPATDGHTFGQVGPFTVTITSGPDTITFTPSGLGAETAVILCEAYVRNGQPKVRAIGQGFASGLAGVATMFGIEVDDDAPVAPPPAPAAPPTAARPRVSFTKGEDELPVDLRKKLNLRKAIVADVLEGHGMLGLTARVILVLDVSGSTARMYKAGVFHRAVERVVPVAAQLDDDGEMQAWVMGTSTARLPDLTVADLPRWMDLHLRVGRSKGAGPRGAPIDGQIDMKAVGAANNEPVTMAAVEEFVRAQPGDTPTLVLFFHDGGVTDNRGVERAVRHAVDAPIFWQFIGLGRANYGILQRLDDLSGRDVDNTGFFALDDIDTVSDPDLYGRILQEFPDWVRAYYAR